MEDGIVHEEKTSISSSTSISGNIKAEEHLIINGTIKGNVEILNYTCFFRAQWKDRGKCPGPKRENQGLYER